MHSRRDFLQRAALLSGSTFLWGSIPESILAAFEIDPAPGSTFMDAEHIVILMQENRSFDHAFGALRGVRGFADPRTFVMPNGAPAWFQTDAHGDMYGPFRLDLKGSNATWMGSLPHSWLNQNDARNGGRYDKWLPAKASSTPEYSKMPLTMGFYTRRDIPFYYALADAFTVCDQNFCSSLTGTNPNRLYLWTGTVRPTRDGTSFARVRNEEIDYGVEANWTTFPERLEDAGVSWKIYQNEVSITNGFSDDQDFWLSSFGDNPVEWFTQYNIRYAKGHQDYLQAHKEELLTSIDQAQKSLAQVTPGTAAYTDLSKKADKLQGELRDHEAYMLKWAKENWDGLPDRSKRLHSKAFATNVGDTKYRTLTTLQYSDGGTQREVKVPAGDVLYQFRKDVENGQLPTVSWLVSPEAFSDHPSSAWYGAWYLAEAMDILTKNPEVWKKTIFILTYDENDGYFDHCQPFVAPNPKSAQTGKTSANIDTSADYVQLEQDMQRYPAAEARGGSIGLGFRVPLVVASPWSRGGAVCSQVFDHTSVLMFLETFLTTKTGRPIKEENISHWRRTVCGDLTSLFKPFDGAPVASLTFPPRDEFIEDVHKAQFKGLPGYSAIPASARAQGNYTELLQTVAKFQEPGIRTACPLNYELYVDAIPSQTANTLTIQMSAKNAVFGPKALGSPFMAYSYFGPDGFSTRAYALQAGDSLEDSWEFGSASDGKYHVRVDGPNGFMREFIGSALDPRLEVLVTYAAGGKALSGDLNVQVLNQGITSQTVVVTDLAYGAKPQQKTVKGGAAATFKIASSAVSGWYDFRITTTAAPAFVRNCAGRVETGQWSTSDPQFGRI